MRRPAHGLHPPDLHRRLGVGGLRRREPAVLSAVSAANRRRNARGGRERWRRWSPAREALWAVLDPLVAPGARVAVVGAGNGDTAPLRALAQRGSLTLVDLDEAALERSRRRAGQAEVVVHDVTEGRADVALARDAPLPVRGTAARPAPLPGAPFDVVVADLLFSQLLYPALLDAGRGTSPRLRTAGPSLTRLVVARLHASAALVVHVHDAVGWWEGHQQPHTLEDVLADPALIARCTGPTEADPRTALRALGIPHEPPVLWRWPFTNGVDYLAVSTVAGR